VHVFAVEYPGYGLCWDAPKNAEQVNRHAGAAVSFVHQILGFPFKSIILYGACVGVGPAMCVAVENDFAGLVLVGAFLSVRKMVRHNSKIAACCIQECYPNDDRAALITTPALLFHGEEDKMVPVAHAVELHDKFQGRKKLVSLSGLGHHSNLTQDQNLMFGPIADFFELPGSPVEQQLCVPPWTSNRQLALKAAESESWQGDLGASPPGVGAKTTQANAGDIPSVAQSTEAKANLLGQQTIESSSVQDTKV
jgi:hypothetical protein